jgi:hypothetical protein
LLDVCPSGDFHEEAFVGLFAALLGTAMAGPDAPPVLPPNIAVDIQRRRGTRGMPYRFRLSKKEALHAGGSDGPWSGDLYVPPGKETRSRHGAGCPRNVTGQRQRERQRKLNPQIIA